MVKASRAGAGTVRGCGRCTAHATATAACIGEQLHDGRQSKGPLIKTARLQRAEPKEDSEKQSPVNRAIAPGSAQRAPTKTRDRRQVKRQTEVTRLRRRQPINVVANARLLLVLHGFEVFAVLGMSGQHIGEVIQADSERMIAQHQLRRIIEFVARRFAGLRRRLNPAEDRSRHANHSRHQQQTQHRRGGPHPHDRRA